MQWIRSGRAGNPDDTLQFSLGRPPGKSQVPRFQLPSDWTCRLKDLKYADCSCYPAAFLLDLSPNKKAQVPRLQLLPAALLLGLPPQQKLKLWKDIHSWLHTLLRGCPIFHIWMLRCGRIPSTPLAWLFPSRFVLTRKVFRSAIHTFLVIFGCVWWTLYEQLVFGSFGDIPDGIYVSLVVMQRFRESMYRFGQVLNSFGGFGERIRFQMFWLHVMACSWTMCLVMFVTWVRCFWAISHVNFTRFCNVSSQTRGEAVNRSRHKQKHLKTAFVSCGVWSKRKAKGVLSPLCNWSWNLCFVDILDLTLGIPVVPHKAVAEVSRRGKL